MIKIAILVVTTCLCFGSSSIESPIRQGVDVSHWQGDVRWGEISRDKISFAFAKATEGDRYVDPRFHYNWREMKKAGLVRGAYHFLDPMTDGVTQAGHFLHVVDDLEPGDFLPAVDVERMKRASNRDLNKVLDDFVGEIRRRTGLDCIIYVSPAFWNDHLRSVQSGMRSQPLWVAEYGVDAPRSLEGLEPWTIWQYTRTGRLSGIDGRCDRLKGRSLDGARIPTDWKQTKPEH